MERRRSTIRTPPGKRPAPRWQRHCLYALVVAALAVAGGPVRGADGVSSAAPLSASAAPVALELTFRETCWAEIYDASGEPLFYDVGREGQTLSYRGVPPFHLVLGNARGVEILFAGKAIETAGYPPGRVKRLLLVPGEVISLPSPSVDVKAPNRPASDKETAPTSPPAESLVLSFREESWTVVHDATGAFLFQDRGKPGQRAEMKGVPPLKLLLGNARGVDVTFAGEEVDTERYPSGKAAHLVLESASSSNRVTTQPAKEPIAKAEPVSRTDKPSTDSVAPAPHSPAPLSRTETVELIFREESWTEAYDATGTRLVYDLGKAGEWKQVAGLPPIKLLLGNPRGVDVVFGGATVETRDYPSGKVAHLLLEAASAAATSAPSTIAAPPAAAGTIELLERIAPQENRPDLSSPDAVSMDVTEEPDEDEVEDGNAEAEPATNDESAAEAEEGPAVVGGATEAQATEVAAADPPFVDRAPAQEGLPEADVDAAETDDTQGDVEQEETDYPRLTGFSDLAMEYDTLFDAEDPADELDDTLVNLESDLLFEIGPTLFIASTIDLVLDGEDDGLHRFDAEPDGGIFLSELRLQHDGDRYSLFGGKYEPAGTIYGYVPSYFGNYSDDLNLEERIGLGASWFLFRNEDTEMRLSAHAFYRDSSFMSGELVSGVDRNDVVHDDVGDTGRLDNFLLTFNGGNTDWSPGLRYTFGAARQRGNGADLLDERALLASVVHVMELRDETQLELALDLLSLDNAGGFDEETDSVTIGFGYSDAPLFIGVGYSVRINHPGATMDRITEIVVSGEITDSVDLSLGYQRTDEAGDREESFGIVLTYGREWKLW